MLTPTMYETSTIELPTWDWDSLSDPAYTTEKYEHVGGTKIGLSTRNGVNHKCRRAFAPLSGRKLSVQWTQTEKSHQDASENRSWYIYGTLPVHCLRHREVHPLCATIVWDTSLETRLGGLLKATYDVIIADKNLKIPAGVDYPGIEIKDVKNSCSLIKRSTNQYVQTSPNIWELRVRREQESDQILLSLVSTNTHVLPNIGNMGEIRHDGRVYTCFVLPTQLILKHTLDTNIQS